MKIIPLSPPAALGTQARTWPPAWTQRIPWLIRLLNWEYWPAPVANLPVVAFWLYFAAKARHLFFFTAANPAIETGGVLGESKMDILRQIPAAYRPATLFVPRGSTARTVLAQLAQQQMSFPLIVKPNVGERGNGVEKVETTAALMAYLADSQVDLIVQAYVDYPEEYSVLYYRFPGEPTGQITSLCRKAYLTVVGDGQRSLRMLIEASPRAYLQLPKLAAQWGDPLAEVPEPGQEILLVPIGNHARGTKFLNANPEIDADLVQTFDRLSQALDGIYVGRFDLKTQSLAHLKRGEAFQLLEINGVAGEPVHVYDPSYPVRWAYRDLLRHWQMVYRVSQAAHRQGVPYMSLREGWPRLWAYLRHLKQLKQQPTSAPQPFPTP